MLYTGQYVNKIIIFFLIKTLFSYNIFNLSHFDKNKETKRLPQNLKTIEKFINKQILWVGARSAQGRSP